MPNPSFGYMEVLKVVIPAVTFLLGSMFTLMQYFFKKAESASKDAQLIRDQQQTQLIEKVAADLTLKLAQIELDIRALKGDYTNLVNEIRSLERRYHQIELDLARNYITKNEYQEAIKRLYTKIDEVLERLNELRGGGK